MPAMLAARTRTPGVRTVGIVLARGAANASPTFEQSTAKRRARILRGMTNLTAAPLSPSHTVPIPPRLPGLTVVLPCFNEAPNIALAIHHARGAAAWNADEYQVIVVDDGSTDGTFQIATDVARQVSDVRVVQHDRNRGYGAALASGLRAARMPWVLLTDADLQFDLDQLERFVPLAHEADLVLGWRIDRRDPLHRRVNAAAWNWLVRRSFGLQVRDVDCAFKLIRREVVDGMPLTSDGAMISAELLVRAVAGGARVRELGVDHGPRLAGESSGANPRVVLRALHELRQLRHELRGHNAAPAAVTQTTPTAV
jgi:glycosyltransferase involved in cell wall biosynthesis